MFAHRRDESRSFGELRFPAAELLDVTELARRWASWLDLTDSDPVPLRSRHALFLARMLTGEDEPIAPSWFSTVSVTSSRFQVIAQARAVEYHCGRPDRLPAGLRGPRWRALVAALDRFADLPVTDRIIVVMLLTQLGFHREVVRLLPALPAGRDPLGQQLAYEAARAAYQLNRRSPVPARIFGWLAENAVRPALRTLAALQLVSAHSRDGTDRRAASRWLAAARTSTGDLGAEPEWLARLVRSRYHRAAALREVAVGDRERVLAHLRSALRDDDALAGLVESPAQRHYQLENRGLVYEAHLKFDTLTGLDSAPAETVANLLALDPVDPEPLYAIGNHLARRERWEAARDVFLRGAGTGTLRGAMAAGAAAVCAERLGRHDDAERARRLCRELDPAVSGDPK